MSWIVLSKLVFIGLVLANGRQFLGKQVGVSVAVDLVMVGLFAWYLLAVPRWRRPAS